MGFFFTKVERAKRAKPEKKVNTERPPSARKHIPTLHRMGCGACPLNRAEVNTPKMQPTLAAETMVYFLGEAPSIDDDNKGRPLSGADGRLLRECIPSELLNQCSFDNCIRDYTDSKPAWNVIECCRPLVTQSIEQAKPKLIVGLGHSALQWALNSTDMIGLRGRLFAIKVGSHECWFMGTYHPSFIIEKAFNRKKPLNSMWGHCFRSDIKKAIESVGYLAPPTIPTEAEIRENVLIFNAGKGVRQQHGTLNSRIAPPPPAREGATLFDLLAQARRAPVKAIDIETTGLRPYAAHVRILTVAISFGATNFAFAVDHPKAGWSPIERQKILDELELILTDDTIKVAHNAPFELEWFIHYFGKGVVKHEAWECTQLQAHFLDERRGAGQSNDDESRRNAYQALDFLCKMHFGIAYKSMFKLDKKNMAAEDLAEMLIYNGVDTKFTLQLYHIQTEQLKREGLYDAYLMAVPRQATVALMQHLGMDVDQAAVKRLQGQLKGEIEAIENEINNLDVVKQYVKDHNEFNPMGNDAIVIFRDYLKREEIKVQDGKRLRLSVDKHVLEKIDHPLAKLIVTLRNKTKMKSTYIDGLELGKGKLVYPDGKLHTNFNTTFTVTARLSSDEPNMQNFPKRNDAFIRQQIVAPPGHYIVAADYGQLEACTAAMCSKDALLIKSLWENYDIHMFWAARLAELAPEIVGGDFADPKVAAKFRSWIKNQLVFPAIFGSKSKSIATALGVDIIIIDKLMKEFWERLSGVAKYQKDTMTKYYDVGYVEAPTGRRRHYPMTRNEAINAPIQGLASDIVVEAMVRLSYMAATEGKWYLHPRLNVHDDLTMVVPDNLLEGAIDTITRVMLTPSFPCVNVPLSVTVSIGRDWFNLEELDKYWSKDLT